ncbi:MAG: hypothetical protein WAX69_24230 [Victivallales bacterium]
MTAADMRMALSMVLPGRLGVNLPETAKIIGVSHATVSRLRKKFLTGKRADLNWKSGWGGRRRGNLSEMEEGKFIKKWNRKMARLSGKCPRTFPAGTSS